MLHRNDRDGLRTVSMPCEACFDLHEEVRIRSPADLKRVLRQAKAGMERGHLRCVDLMRESSEPDLTPSEIPVDGPWDDHVSYELRCAKCGTCFALSAETYHGSGGAWRVRR